MISKRLFYTSFCKTFIGLTVYCIVMMGCKANKKELSQTAKDSILTVAHDDLKRGKLKYYYHSMAAPSSKLTAYIKDSCQVRIVSLPDVQDMEYAYYNKFTDSVVKKKTGKSFAQLSKLIK